MAMVKKIVILLIAFLELVSTADAQAAYTPVPGDLIKVDVGQTVYLVDDLGQRIPLSAKAFEIRYNNNFSLVKSLSEVEVAGRVNDLILNESLSHKNGTLIKYWNDPTIYLLQDGYKRGFATWDSFANGGYPMDKVQLVGDYEIYPTGQVIP